MKKWLVDRGGLVALCALLAYACLAAPHVVDGDNAEFSTLSITGGIAHPSGYPLFVLWLRAWSWLPGTPAHAAALATALLGATTILVLHAACRAWGARPAAATAACAIFAGAPVFLRLATEAEVFVPSALLVSAVLWLAAAAGPVRGQRRAAALGLVAGLALSIHLTCVFVAPIGILGVVRGAREGRAGAAIAVALLGLVVGLSPYLYAFVAPDTPASWGTVRDVGALVRHFRRADYGSLELVAHGARAPATATIGAMLVTIARAWLYLPALAGVAMLGYRIARPAGETRWAWALLALSWLVAGPIFVARFDAAPEGIGLYIEQRFHLLPALLLAIPIAAVLRLPDRLAPLVATAGLALSVLLSLPRVASVHTPALQRFARNVLASLPEKSVAIVGTDAFYYALVYEQTVTPDRGITVVAWPLMARDWYRARVAAHGIVGDPGDGPPEVLLARHVFAAHRALFVEPGETELARAFATYPVGPLARVLPPGVSAPPVDDVLAENRALYDKFDLRYVHPGRDDEWATLVHERYAAPWRAIADVLAAQHRTDEADSARGVAESLEPL